MDKREQILTAAMALLVENGMQATPMSAIARAANTGMGTIYNYFPSKEDLINAIYLYIKQDEVRAIMGPEQPEATRKQFEHFFGMLVRYMIDKPLHFRFMDQFHTSPVITDSTRDEGNRIFGSYLEILRRGQEHGIIKPIGIEELVQFVNGGLMGFVRWLVATGKPLTQAMLENQLRIAWDAIKE